MSSIKKEKHMNKNDFYLQIIKETINPRDIVATRRQTTDSGVKSVISVPIPTLVTMYNVISELKNKVYISQLLSFLDLYHPFVYTKNYNNQQYNIGYVGMKANSYFYNIDGQTLVDIYNLPFACGLIVDESPISNELFQVDASYCRGIGTNDICVVNSRTIPLERMRSGMFNDMIISAIVLNTMDLLQTDTSIFEID